MASLDSVLRQLREEHNQARLQIEKLTQAISAIEGLTGRSSKASANGTRPKRTMSAAARRRIAQAQRARWAKFRTHSRSTVRKSKSNAGTPSKRKLSLEGRKRIAAAARARWARIKAKKAKKAG